MIAGLGEVDGYESDELRPANSAKSSDSKSVEEWSHFERRLSFSQSQNASSHDSVVNDQLQEELKNELEVELEE